MSNNGLLEVLKIQKLLLQTDLENVELKLLTDLFQYLNQTLVNAFDDSFYKLLVDGQLSLVVEEGCLLTKDDTPLLHKFKSLSRELKRKLRNDYLSSPTPETFQLEDSYDFNASRLSLDIGGTLVKLAYVLEVDCENTNLSDLFQGYNDTIDLLKYLFKRSDEVKITYAGKTAPILEHLHLAHLRIKIANKFTIFFKHLPTTNLHKLIALLKDNEALLKTAYINVTGGGAFKYFEDLSSLGKEIRKCDEMRCLVEGLKLIHKLPNSMLKYDFVYKFTTCCTTIKSLISTGTAYGLVRYLLSSNGRSFDESALTRLSNISEDDPESAIFRMISVNTGKLSYMVGRAYSVRRVFLTGKYVCTSTIDGIADGFYEASSTYKDEPPDLYIPYHCGYVSAFGCLIYHP